MSAAEPTQNLAAPVQFSLRSLLIVVTLSALATVLLGQGILLVGAVAVAAGLQWIISWTLFTLAEYLARRGRGLAGLAVFCVGLVGLGACTLFAFLMFMALLIVSCVFILSGLHLLPIGSPV